MLQWPGDQCVWVGKATRAIDCEKPEVWSIDEVSYFMATFAEKMSSLFIN